MTEIEYITARLGTLEILCQLAEEAAELAQAALKLRRVLDKTNPTPVDFNAAYDNLLEEIADVEGAVKVLTLDRKKEEIAKISSDKITRWAQRLRAVANTNRATGTPTDVPTDTPTAVVKTRQERFIEMFPRAIVFNGALNICPGDIDARQKCHGPKDCRDCRREYWLAAVEEDSHD
jgi:hypothetical protein